MAASTLEFEVKRIKKLNGGSSVNNLRTRSLMADRSAASLSSACKSRKKVVVMGIHQSLVKP